MNKKDEIQTKSTISDEAADKMLEMLCILNFKIEQIHKIFDRIKSNQNKSSSISKNKSD